MPVDEQITDSITRVDTKVLGEPEVNRLRQEKADLMEVIKDLRQRENEITVLLNAALADMRSTSRILTKKLDGLRRT